MIVEQAFKLVVVNKLVVDGRSYGTDDMDDGVKPISQLQVARYGRSRAQRKF